MKTGIKKALAMESESDCGCCGWSSESESEASPVSECPQERWESVASVAASASRLNKMDALGAVLPHLPDCPQATALEHAILNSSDLQTTLRAVERAALAMARAEELVRLA